MKISREDVQEAMKRSWHVWNEAMDATSKEEIEDPEPEVVIEFGEWYRLRSDGSVQYRTPSNAWVRCEVDENYLAKIAEEVALLARDIQRKDEALEVALEGLRSIRSRSCDHPEMDQCSRCVASDLVFRIEGLLP